MQKYKILITIKISYKNLNKDYKITKIQKILTKYLQTKNYQMIKIRKNCRLHQINHKIISKQNQLKNGKNTITKKLRTKTSPKIILSAK